jgi:hypothetical protein
MSSILWSILSNTANYLQFYSVLRTHLSIQPFKSHKCQSVVNYILKPHFSGLKQMYCHLVRSGKGTVLSVPPPVILIIFFLILRIKLLRNSLRNHTEIPNNTKNQNSEQKEIRIHNDWTCQE